VSGLANTIFLNPGVLLFVQHSIDSLYIALISKELNVSYL